MTTNAEGIKKELRRIRNVIDRLLDEGAVEDTTGFVFAALPDRGSTYRLFFAANQPSAYVADAMCDLVEGGQLICPRNDEPVH